VTKTCQEYVSKPIVANVMEVLKETDWVEEEILSTELVGGYESDDEEYFHSLPEAESFTNSGFIESCVSLEFDESTECKEEVLICYASVVKIHLTLQPLFAMVTRHFQGNFAGLDVVFMIDTGSELNLMAQEFYDRTNLAIDLDRTHWSLKGINGCPVSLGGCVQDAEIKISGRWFDHHIFISREGTGKQEIILGQPWLQWYSASIQYTHQGAMNSTPGAPRNAATLSLDQGPRIEKVVDVDAEK